MDINYHQSSTYILYWRHIQRKAITLTGLREILHHIKKYS